MLHEGGNVRGPSSGDERPDLFNLIVLKRDGDLGCRHTKNHTIAAAQIEALNPGFLTALVVDRGRHMKQGLLLAGGGTKDAFTFGCVKASRDRGAEFDAVGGASQSCNGGWLQR